MRIPSGTTNQYIYFVAVDATDFSTRETGLTGFTVYRSRDGAASAAMTTPTVNETDATNMPGVYGLLCDEDMTIAAGNSSEEMVFHITAAGMAPVTRTIELYRPIVTEGNTLGVASDGDISGNVDGSVASVVAQVTADVTAISGDSTAADNLESMYDGTGYVTDTAPASRSQVDSIGAASGGALNFAVEADNTGAAIKGVTFVGSQTGTFANTEANDGTYHTIDDTGNAIDIVYQIDAGTNRIAVEATFKGYLTGSNDIIDVQAYDFVGADWETRFTLNGQTGTTNVTESIKLLSKHTGTSGADSGLVLIRFVTTGQSNPQLNVDELLVSAVINATSLGFVNGAVWVDTVNGVSGTAEGIGNIGNPVDNIADAKTIADNNNLKRFQLLPSSSVTLASSFDRYEFTGSGYTVALGGQSVSGAFFSNAIITGNDDGSNADATIYFFCSVGGNSLGLHRLNQCGITSTMTLAEAGTYDYINCHSRIAGTGTPLLDFGVAVGATNVNMRDYSGGIEITNMAATDNMSLEGNGQLVINAACTGGTVAIRGNFTVADNASGAVTLSDDARYDITRNRLNELFDTALASQPTAGSMLGDLTEDDAGTQRFTANALEQAPSGGGGVADWTVSEREEIRGRLGITGTTSAGGNTPTLSTFNSNADAVDIGSINGDAEAAQDLAASASTIVRATAAAGTLSTTQMTTNLSEATDDHYNGRIIIWTSGSLKDQATNITDYSGTGGLLTFTAVTEAPSASDSFVIV